MKKQFYSDSQILKTLKLAKIRISVAYLCRKNGMSSTTFFTWRSNFGGMEVSFMGRIKELERENRK